MVSGGELASQLGIGGGTIATHNAWIMMSALDACTWIEDGCTWIEDACTWIEDGCTLLACRAPLYMWPSTYGHTHLLACSN